MSHRLPGAIVATFGIDDAKTVRESFASYDEREWLRSREWMHTSGLALYFLARAKRLGIEEVMPQRMLSGLEENLADNRVRTNALFNEFVKVNMEFQRTQLSYANMKGFTLAPHACSDPAVRYQHDLDFLVSRRDAEKCRQALERHGYQLTAVFGDTWEFLAGEVEVLSMGDLYRARKQRSLEVHLVPEKEEADGRRDRLSRLRLQVWNGFEFPALSERDKLLGQALHLFKHFQTAWTRTAWMLEYATAIRSHEGDESFWQETVAAIEAAPETKLGIGIATLAMSRAFGVAPPAEFVACTVDVLPEQVRLWVERYETRLVFVQHPGSKLYLLLQDVLLQDRPEWQSQKRRKLFPSRLPPHTYLAGRKDGTRLRMRMAIDRLGFIWLRFRFHVTEGLRYKIEVARWKRFVAGLQV
jgi:hypothetical protein